MGLILSIETATTNCSVALAQDGKLKAVKEFAGKNYSHAEKLHPFIKELVESSGYTFTDLEAIAVSKGPGSYTGLRIGVSAAKGLCFALNIPLIAIETLEILALQSTHTTYKFVVPMLDARRMEVYTAVFNDRGEQLLPTEAKILTPSSYATYLEQGQVLFIGNAIQKFREICTHSNAMYQDALPSAKEMIELAEACYQKKETVDVAYFEPYYLKDFIAK